MTCPFCGAAIKDEHPKFCPSCGKTITAAPLAVAGPTGLLGPGQEETFFEGRPAVIGSLGALFAVILTVGLAAIYLWLKTLGTRYRITSQRVIVETGVFGKRVDQLDLYRIVDFVVERSFGQRVMGTGTITIDSMDKTTPVTRIEGIHANVMGLYERLRAAAEVEKQRRAVRPMDIERP
jgi:membrane protein YdbS with pleckstrin-like domain